MIEFDITGDDEICRVLRGLPAAIARDAALESLVEACQPTIEAARAAAPVETGGLRDSIGGVLRKYRRGLMLMFVIGPRWGFGKDGREPARYGHLVEFGHIQVAKIFGTSLRKGTAIAMGFVEGKPFLRPAWDSTKEAVLAKFSTLFGAKVEAIVRRRASRQSAADARTMAQWAAMQEEKEAA